MVNKKKIALITPSITAGGAERVLSILANYLQEKPDLEVHLILLTGGDLFYPINENVIVHRPPFDYTNYKRWQFTWMIFRYLRRKLKEIMPYSLLSFGGKYNSFVLLATKGLNIRTFVSDRSRPGISYGKFLDILNRIVYRDATGIIAQTSKAKHVSQKLTNHKNITIIGNPLPILYNSDVNERKNVILNVGRFIKSKQQNLLIEIFAELHSIGNWELWFLGDGEYLESCKELVKKLNLEEKVKFYGSRKDVNDFLNTCKIFAFTSISEGFPNALGEAMSAKMACISFDCNAGPSDLIDDGINGYLIEEGNKELYKEKLAVLMKDEQQRLNFAEAAYTKVLTFNSETICEKFLKVLN